MKIIAVLNGESGTLRTLDIAAFIADAKAAFTAEGHELHCDVTDGEHILSVLEAAAQNPDYDVLLAGGGDGTISAAAALAWHNDKILGVLPAGTMNLFARSLNMPQNISVSIHALVRATVQAVDIGTCNGQVFVHQVAIGLHPLLIRIREKYNYSSRFGKIWANFRAMVQLIRHVPRVKTEAVIDGRTIKGVYSALAISNNPYGDGVLPVAPDVQTGRLGFYLAKPLPVSGMIRLFWDILRGKWRSNLAIAEDHARSVQLKTVTHKTHQYMSVDGELLPLPATLEIQIHPAALKVLMPEDVGQMLKDL
ncbi:diacylglycerol/lipid kinase family protein [Pseudochrobactrum asaccharolyticum]|uniref:Diacylglycerol kinase family enzyme n=1 Tax=Pseudochrobactrum asaccharolyticum TaxID=354351 RepID=A0A366DSN0_9HYPH|nr:diacylglycerol kinase family protein [Pseudochrobactrum asaccharolyticum]RBO93092.1 diacylglycerol kinase family enzyme [Pseudochrobactrum asaccharolyticum]